MKENRQALFFLLIPGVLFIYNVGLAFYHKRLLEYFNTPLYAVINMLIAIVFAYFLTQYKNDRRQKREIIESIINKLLDDFSNSKMYSIDCNSDIEHIRITQRSVNNRLGLLKDCVNEFKLEKDIEYAKQQFTIYWDTISNHINDVEHLKKSRQELFNLVTNITNGLEKSIIKLYCIKD